MWPCLLSSHRTRVVLIGVEGFPHGGFRHFVRYINLRRVTPEEQGEEKEGEIREQIGDRMSRDLGGSLRTKYSQGALENRPPHRKQDKHAYA